MAECIAIIDFAMICTAFELPESKNCANHGKSQKSVQIKTE